VYAQGEAIRLATGNGHAAVIRLLQHCAVLPA
jgi:hypothetical protein